MEWVFLGAIVFILILIIWEARVESRKRKAMTEEEWEHRERQSIGMLGAGAMGLHQILHADLEKAQAVQMDARQGMLPSAERENNKAEKEGE